MNTPKNIDELDEMRARALNPIPWEDGLWDNSEEDAYLRKRGMDDALGRARAIREADALAGLVTVPREPTLNMLAAIARQIKKTISHAYEAAIAASPFYTEPSP